MSEKLELARTVFAAADAGGSEGEGASCWSPALPDPQMPALNVATLRRDPTRTPWHEEGVRSEERGA